MIKLHNELLTRVKRTWEQLITGGGEKKRPPDQLVRINLPPLMGRRDAAYDRAVELISDPELFAHDEAYRRSHYLETFTLLRCAENDTRSILQTLTSPDTASREKTILEFLVLTQNMVQVLDGFAELADKVLTEENPVLKDFGLHLSEAESIRRERLLSESEITAANHLRTFCTRAHDKLTRYREYTSKNFSKSNASRYHKAYDAYFEIFHEEHTPDSFLCCTD